jgi:hypothetical protein
MILFSEKMTYQTEPVIIFDFTQEFNILGCHFVEKGLDYSIIFVFELKKKKERRKN